MTSKRSRRSGWARFALVAAAVFGLGALAGSVGFYWFFLRDLPDPRSVADYSPSLASTVFDRKGRPIGEFFVERRRLVEFEDVPRHVIDAFVSAEDSSFFEHEGIDFPGILRAAWVNLLAGGEIRQGGSTITQQMVKTLLLTPERSYRRKIREMILARRIEKRFTKQEILYLYLNQIYFGNGAYGIGEAARSYYDKPVSELDVSEGAQLAGLPKAPTRYSPFNNPQVAERRRRYVLGRMRDDGALDEIRYEQAVANRPQFVDGSKNEDFEAAAYFTEEVRRFLFDELGGDKVLKEGLRIETTLDLDQQVAAVAAVQKGLEELDHRNGYRGPARRIESGEIEAELETLATSNGLVPPSDVESASFADEVAPELAEAEEAALADEHRREILSQERRAFLGVVTRVDKKDQRADVALAPDVRGSVVLADVDWARPLDPDTRPQPVKRIDAVFKVGDVASFEVLEAPESSEQVEKLRLTLYQEPNVQGALISIEVGSDDILALVGGYDFARSQFNRATQARRQPGSAFKPLVYGAALAKLDSAGRPRYTPASIVHDRPKVYTDRSSGFVWKPKNYGREFYGPITLRTALAKSVNNAAVHLCDEVGVGSVLRYAKRLGIHSPLEPSLGLALGISGVSLLELTRAYAVYPNGGKRVVPRFVRRVLDRDGEVLLEEVALGDPLAKEPPSVSAGVPDGVEIFEVATSKRVIPAEQAYLMTDLLRAVVTEGTGRRAAKLGRPLGGKTGTTNDQADAWFVGFSPELATGVWVGFDEIRFLGAGETGSRAALPIWVDFMGKALAERPIRNFEVPRGRIVWARIDRETGLLASRTTEKVVFQPFIAGTEPTRSSAAAQQVDRARQDLREDSFGGDAALQFQLDDF